jgi:hypothetical protein
MGRRRLFQVALPVPGQQRPDCGGQVQPLQVAAPGQAGQEGRQPVLKAGEQRIVRQIGPAATFGFDAAQELDARAEIFQLARPGQNA